jgi:hypothetical protein
MKSRTLPGAQACLLIALTSFLCGCTSFESRWKSAPSLSDDGVSGRWIGTWQNTNNAHGGPLQAVVIDKGTNSFSAYFHAGWGKHSGTFRTPIRGGREGDTFRFTGSKRVFGVKIDTAGTIRSNEFHANYESRFDNGTFTLKRPHLVEQLSPAPGSPSKGANTLEK